MDNNPTQKPKLSKVRNLLERFKIFMAQYISKELSNFSIS